MFYWGVTLSVWLLAGFLVGLYVVWVDGKPVDVKVNESVFKPKKSVLMALFTLFGFISLYLVARALTNKETNQELK